MDALSRLSPPPALGERVVVRYRTPDGMATDAIGWLEQLETDVVVLAEVSGRLVRVERELIVAARRLPAARGGPDPRRTSAEELQRIALPAWVADSEPLGEWTLRAAGGFTGRANSCLAVGDPGVSVAEAAQRIVSYAGAHGIAPLAQVVTDSAPEQALRGLGWAETYVPTDVLVTRLSTLLKGRPPDPQVTVSTNLEPAWAAAYQLSRPNRADPYVLRRILEGGSPRGLAGVKDGERLIAIGRGHVSADWLGLASLWTDPDHRRHGWATAVLATLGHWAARRGARHVYLQVARENVSAHVAYERLGFAAHHSYRYLTPEPSQP